MKNIYTIITNKPSRLHKIGNEIGLTNKPNSNFLAKQLHIYITSNEEIKDGWSYDRMMKSVNKTDNVYSSKIILTTDPDLIADGVQAIDDEFLEWFVKNLGCESVEVEWLGTYTSGIVGYKIIIPKEEPKQDRTCTNNCSDVCGECQILKPKQETFEEAAERLYDDLSLSFYDGLKLGAKWQAERMYSEEEVLEILFKSHNAENTSIVANTIMKWFEQFKKK